MDRADLILGVAARDDQLHGVWMKSGEKVHTDASELGYRTIVEAFKELLGKTKDRSAPDAVVLAVPFHRLLMRSIDVPPAPDLPLGPFAEQFAAAELPYPVEEAVIDYSVIESPQRPQERRLLLAAGQKKDLEPYRAAIQSMSIRDRRAIPQTLALHAMSEMPSDIPNSLLIYFWKSHMDILWCSYSHPRHLRLVPMLRDRALSGVTSKDPDFLTKISTEIRLSGEYIRKQSAVEMRSILCRIVSTDRRFDELPALLQPEVPFMVDGRILDETEGALLAQGACRVAASGAPDLNFFEPKKSKSFDMRPAVDEKQKMLVGSLVCVMLILVLAIVKSIVSHTWTKSAESQRTEIAASPSTLPEGAAAQLAAFLTAPDAVDALGRLSESIPPETELQDVSIDENEISLRGTAPRAMSVYEQLSARGVRDIRFVQDVVAAEQPGRELFALAAENPFKPAEVTE